MWVLVDDGAGAGVDVEGGWGACGVVYDDVVGGGDGVDGYMNNLIIDDT